MLSVDLLEVAMFGVDWLGSAASKRFTGGSNARSWASLRVLNAQLFTNPEEARLTGFCGAMKRFYSGICLFFQGQLPSELIQFSISCAPAVSIIFEPSGGIAAVSLRIIR